MLLVKSFFLSLGMICESEDRFYSEECNSISFPLSYYVSQQQRMIDITANFFLCATLKRKEQLVTSHLELFQRQTFLDFVDLLDSWKLTQQLTILTTDTLQNVIYSPWQVVITTDQKKGVTDTLEKGLVDLSSKSNGHTVYIPRLEKSIHQFQSARLQCSSYLK